MSRKKSKKTLSAIITLLVFIVAAWQFFGEYLPAPEQKGELAPSNSDGKLTACFLDVDQGDCSLFYLPDGKTMLIDAGNRGDGEKIVAYLNKNGVERLDYVIATHPHADHIGGMSDVIDFFDIGQVFAPKIAADDIPTSKSYEDFLTSVQSKGLKITAPKHGTTIFEGEDYKAECFSPCSDNYEDLNNYSVTIKLTYGVHSFLMTGDAEGESESEMLKANYNLSCDVLKVGHHGSSTSSSSAFLKAADPKFAIISCGEDNSYGHPHKETLSALKSKTVLRTDINKTIIFTADGKNENGLNYTINNETVA